VGFYSRANSKDAERQKLSLNFLVICLLIFIGVITDANQIAPFVATNRQVTTERGEHHAWTRGKNSLSVESVKRGSLQRFIQNPVQVRRFHFVLSPRQRVRGESQEATGQS
jgi:hypothetical protein